MVGFINRSFAPRCAGLVLSLLVTSCVWSATLDGVAYVSYGRSVSSAAGAGNNTDSSSSALSVSLTYGSYLWDRRFLEYWAGFSTSLSSGRLDNQSNGFRSRGYNLGGRFFSGRPLSFTIFGSKLTTRNFADLLLSDSSSQVLIPLTEFEGTFSDFGINGRWDSDVFDFFDFGYARRLTDQTSDGFRGIEKNEEMRVQIEKNSERTRNRFHLTRNEQEVKLADFTSGSWYAVLSNSFQLINDGYLNTQNLYSSTSSLFQERNVSPSFPPTGPGIALPETKSSATSFYSGGNWNHLLTPRIRYVISGSYNLSQSEGFETGQWTLDGDVIFTPLRWLSLFGGAGRSTINFQSEEIEEKSDIRNIRGGASLSGSWKGFSGVLSGNAAKGIIEQINNGDDSGDWRSTGLSGTLSTGVIPRHYLSLGFQDQASRSDLPSILNYDRTVLTGELKGESIKSFTYGASYTHEHYVPLDEEFLLLESRFFGLSAYLTRPIHRRGSLSFNFGSYRQTILDDKTVNRTYSLIVSLQLTSHLSSSTTLEIKDYNRNLLQAGILSVQDQLYARLRVDIKYVFGLSEINLRVFYDQSHFDFQPSNFKSETMGSGIIISFVRRFSIF